MTHILGVSAYYHDSAAALLRDGELVAAAQEERFSRVKFDHEYPGRAIAYCLNEADITPDDLDYVVFYEKPLPKFERILLTQLATFPRSWRVFREAMTAWFGGKLWIKTDIMRRLNVPASKVLFVEHHLSHAASAMFTSPFRHAAVLTVDGVGEWTTTSLGHARADWDTGAENAIELTEELRFPHSLGLLYSTFTAWLGFRVNSGEYKVMGMAPYGRPSHRDKIERLAHVNDDGSLELALEYFAFHHSLTDSYSSKFVDLFGTPRVPESAFFTEESTPDIAGREEQAKQNQYYADIAASAQEFTEETLLRMIAHLHEQTGLSDLVMAGGVALNSVANGRIMREGPFERIYIQPNAGDAGGALGAALYAWHVYLKKPRTFVMEHAFYGQGYSDAEVRSALDESGVAYEHVEDEAKLCGMVVDALIDQLVVGLFQGRFEWGPRALGNRSIIADPRRPEMKGRVNEMIKFREPFRPFAPVLEPESASRFLDLGSAVEQHPPHFMLMVCDVVPERRSSIPAVSHMGTARPQLVTPDCNSVYRGVLRQFGEATSVPVLLNTSFNLRADPIAASPADALRTFLAGGLDMLAAGPFLVRKP